MINKVYMIVGDGTHGSSIFEIDYHKEYKLGAMSEKELFLNKSLGRPDLWFNQYKLGDLSFSMKDIFQDYKGEMALYNGITHLKKINPNFFLTEDRLKEILGEKSINEFKIYKKNKVLFLFVLETASILRIYQRLYYLHQEDEAIFDGEGDLKKVLNTFYIKYKRVLVRALAPREKKSYSANPRK